MSRRPPKPTTAGGFAGFAASASDGFNAARTRGPAGIVGGRGMRPKGVFRGLRLLKVQTRLLKGRDKGKVAVSGGSWGRSFG